MLRERGLIATAGPAAELCRLTISSSLLETVADSGTAQVAAGFRVTQTIAGLSLPACLACCESGSSLLMSLLHVIAVFRAPLCMGALGAMPACVRRDARCFVFAMALTASHSHTHSRQHALMKSAAAAVLYVRCRVCRCQHAPHRVRTPPPSSARACMDDRRSGSHQRRAPCVHAWTTDGPGLISGGRRACRRCMSSAVSASSPAHRLGTA